MLVHEVYSVTVRGLAWLQCEVLPMMLVQAICDVQTEALVERNRECEQRAANTSDSRRPSVPSARRDERDGAQERT